MVKSLQKKSKIAQIYYYELQSAGINLQSPQSDSTPWTLTLGGGAKVAKSLNVEVGINMEGGIFWKKTST